MNVHRGVEHGENITIRARRRTVAGGAKMQRRGDTHVGKEPEKEIQEVRAVCGTKSAFSSLKLLIRHREEKTGEESGGREVLEGGNNLFIVVTVVTKV